MKINKKEYYNELLPFYNMLLTTKQQEIMNYYYYEDFSLSEIAEINNTTRSAIYDAIRKSNMLLEKYEIKLKLLQKYKNRVIIYKELLNKEDEYIKNLINKLIEIEEEN